MSRAVALLAASLLALLGSGCAPIDVSSEVSLHPREAPPQLVGLEQLEDRDFVVEFVQLGPRLLVSLREHPSCVEVRHVPVMRVEEIHRSNRGFVAWDFALGTITGAFAGLAFARPQLFSDRLVDGQGRVVYNLSSGYIVGGVFAAISAGLFAAGIVDALRSRDETRYAAAFEVELGPEHPCAGSDAAGLAVAGRSLRLRVGDLEYEATTDDQGRARFQLHAWDGPISADGRAPALLEITRPGGGDVEPKLLVLSLRVPFDPMVEAHTGVADTRSPPVPAAELGPIEGPGTP